MQLIKSTLFGSEGSCRIFGTPLVFEKTFPPKRNSFIAKCLLNRPLYCLMQGYLHTLVHEVSHAIFYKRFTGEASKVTIVTNPSADFGTGYTDLDLYDQMTSNWRKTAIDLAGPAASIAFSGGKLVAAVALKKRISRPVAYIMGGAGALWMVGELFSAAISALKRDDGDFGLIAQRSYIHLAFASIVLISECALAIFAASKLSK